jgi:putative salt-induced outer membrane protein YdiY
MLTYGSLERVAERSETAAMRPKLRWLVLGLMCAASDRAIAQSTPGPSLLPPPEMALPDSLPSAEALPLPEAADISSGESELFPEDIFVDEDPTWYRPKYWLDPLSWDTGLELGINGSSGTSESLSIRTGGHMKRESRFSKLDMSTYYNRTTKGGSATQNNAQFDVRNDWLLDERSPWTLFGTANVFYDEFQAFDLQTNANTGVGHRFIHDPDLRLMGRFGAGTSREIGGPDDRWVPESLLGFEYSQRLSPTQKFYGKLDYFPEWEEIGEYRLVADTGWEIALVEPSNLSLKLSASDRYDSTPNGANPHLVNYSVLLLLKL